MSRQSAGILLYRSRDDGLEVLLIHPGGPWWRARDAGAWQIPKGGIEADEEPAAAALREFAEEVGIALTGAPQPLARIRQAGGKWVDAFTLEQDLDPAAIESNVFEMEWPPRSGQFQAFPEVDRAAWFTLPQARTMILRSQEPLLDSLVRHLSA